jgi:hypothetical protein
MYSLRSFFLGVSSVLSSLSPPFLLANSLRLGEASFSDSSDYFGVQIFGEQGFVVA